MFQLAVFLLTLSCAVAQEHFTPVEIREDLTFLKKRLEKYHPGLYRYNDSLAYEERFSQLLRGFASGATYQDLFNGMAPLITDIRDLHTSYSFPAKKYGKDPGLVPLVIRRFGDRFFIHFNASSDSTLLRTSELLSLNGQDIGTVYKNLQTLYGPDNGNHEAADYYAEKAFSSYYLRYYGTSDSLRVGLRLPGDSVVTERVIAMETGKDLLKNLAGRYKNALRKNFEFVLADSVLKVAKVDITSFTLKGGPLDITQRKFKKELKKRFALIQKAGVKHLIIDLRGNGGGYIPNVGRLMKYIVKEPFTLVDSMIFRKKAFFRIFRPYSIGPPLVAALVFRKLDDRHRFYANGPKARQKPVRKNHFDGKLYFLMDGGSYSATTFTLGLAYDMNLGTFIGTQPGGANWGSFAGEWDNFRLPHSGIKIHSPFYKIVHRQPEGRAKTFFIQPDYYVGQGFGDFLKRDDTVLRFTLNMIRASQN